MTTKLAMSEVKSLPTTLPMPSATKMLLEEHVRVHVVTSSPASAAALILKHLLSPVVLRTQLLVRQHLVRLGDVLKHLFRLLFVVRVLIGVPFLELSNLQVG